MLIPVTKKGTHVRILWEVFLLEKVKVGLAGELQKECQKAALLALQSILRAHPCVNFIDKTKDYLYALTEETDNIEDLGTDVFLEMVDEVDVVVIVATKSDKNEYGSLGWKLGYCWSQGTPVVLVTLDDPLRLSGIAERAVHAHLSTLLDVLDYDFVDQPYIPYTSAIA